MRWLSLLLCLALIMAFPTLLDSAGFSATIQLTANPEAINADGKSVTTVSAEVRDSSGNLAPDGTQVNFTTSLGTIESSVGTVAGVARATLQSGTTTGTAIVSAALAGGGAVAQRKVEFLPPGTAVRGRSYVTISSKSYLVYSMDYRTMEALGGVQVAHQGMVIDADSAQLKLDSMELRARQRTGHAPIRIRKAGKTVEASLLYYDFNARKGVIITTTDAGAKRQTLSAYTMVPEDDESEDQKADIFNFTDMSDSAVITKARSITIREGQDVQFRRAEFYVGEKRILTVPLHVMPLTPGSSPAGQILSLGSNGIKVDVPLYFSLSPGYSGSFRIRNQQSGGWGYYASSPGWFLDLEQQYAAGLSGQGTLALTRITGGDWGARWTHSQDFVDGARVYSFVDFPAHRDLYGTINFTKPLKGLNLGLNLRGNKYKGSPSSLSSDLYLQTNAKPLLANKVNYAVSARTSYTNTSFLNESKFGTGLQLQLYGTPVKLGSSTSLSNTLSIGHDWGGRYAGQTLLGTASITHQLGTTGGLGLIYSYTKSPGILGNSTGRHRLSGNMFLSPGSRWNTNMFATYGLDDSSMSLFGDVSYRINGGWRLGALATYQKFYGSKFDDAEFLLGKQVGNQEVMLVWSKSQKKFRVEFGGLKF